MIRRSVASLLVGALAACGAHAAPAPVGPEPVDEAPPEIETTSTTRVLTADTTIRTATGATFQAPLGWTLISSPTGELLRDADGDAVLLLAENQAADAAAAASAAWQLVEPGFALPVLKKLEMTDLPGWDAGAQLEYVEHDTQHHAALLRRRGATWYVALLAGTKAGQSAHAAEINAAVLSWQPGDAIESFVGRAPHRLDNARLVELDRFVTDAMAETGVPGAAIAVVQDGGAVEARGFGVTEAGKDAEVDDRTLFLLGDATAPLTTLMMARLVDAKRLRWDQPLGALWPSLATTAIAGALRLRDTVCGCAGLPRHELELAFEYGKATAEQRVAALAVPAPLGAQGPRFADSALAIAAGGYLAAHAAQPTPGLDAAFDRVFRDEVLTPLGMDQSTLDPLTAADRGHATPHAIDVTLQYTPVPLAAEAATLSVRPARGLWTSAGDLARYLVLELDDGVLDGKRVVTAASLHARRRAAIAIDANASFGLGLVIGRGLGVTSYGRHGETLGYTSDLWFIPEAGVGVALLANGGDAGAFRAMVQRRVLELVFDGKPQAEAQLAAYATQRARIAADNQRDLALVPDPDWIADLVGAYRNDRLGRIEIREDGGTWVLDAGEWSAPLGQKHDRRSGADRLELLAGPLVGRELVVQQGAGRATLVLGDEPDRYVFAPAP